MLAVLPLAIGSPSAAWLILAGCLVHFGALFRNVPEKNALDLPQMARIASFHIIVLFSLFSSFSDVIDVS